MTCMMLCLFLLLLLMLLLSLKIPITLWFYFFPGSAICILFKKQQSVTQNFFLSFLSCHSNTSLQTKSDLLKIEWDVIIIIINIDVVRQRVDCIVMRSTIPNADLTIFSFGCLSLKFYIIHAARIRDYKAVPRYIYVDLHLLYKLMLILITKSFRSFETQQLQIHISF